MSGKRLSKDDFQILGTFKPVGHAIVALPDDDAAERAERALQDAGFDDADVVRYSADEVRAQMKNMIDHASDFAGFGYEITLMRRYEQLAREGCGWLLVYAPEDDHAARVTEVVREHGARAAEKYHRLVVEDLL